jgi:hypothetical protein
VDEQLDAEMAGRGAKRARLTPAGLDVELPTQEAPSPHRLDTPCAATVDSIFTAALAEPAAGPAPTAAPDGVSAALWHVPSAR